MLINAVKQITHISDDEQINSENYLEALGYIDNLYRVMNRLKDAVPTTKDFIFLSTFKGKYTCAKYLIPSTERENEMRTFTISSSLFLEDEKNIGIQEEIRDRLKDFTERIEFINGKLFIDLE